MIVSSNCGQAKFMQIVQNAPMGFFELVLGSRVAATCVLLLAVGASNAPAEPVPVTPAALPAPSVKASSLSLSEAVSKALQNQPKLEAAKARLLRPESALGESRALWNPRLNFDANYTYQVPRATFNQGFQEVVVNPNSSYQAALRLTQVLWDGGSYRTLEQLRQVQLTVESERLRQTQLDLEEEVALAFLRTLAAQEALEVDNSQILQRELQRTQTDHLFQQGTVAKYDVMRADTALLQAKQDLLESERLLEVRRKNLASLLQVPSESLGKEILLTLSPPPKGQSLAAGVAASENELLSRPDLRIAHRSIEEAHARVVNAGKESAPTLSFQSEAAFKNSTALTPGTTWNAGLVFSWPIWDRGLSDWRAKASQADKLEAEQLLKETYRLAQLQVDELRAELRSRERSWQTRLAQEQLASEAARVADLRYQNGLSPQVERQDAVVSAVRAKKDRIVAQYDTLMAQARLLRALGRSQISQEVLP